MEEERCSIEAQVPVPVQAGSLKFELVLSKKEKISMWEIDILFC
jgi:hypothetical protein